MTTFIKDLNSARITRSLTSVSFNRTPLAKASHLFDGLDVYDVPAEGDGHPLAVFGINSKETGTLGKRRRPILLLHGRTWSTIPVYHLNGGCKVDKNMKSLSLIESLYENGLQPYAVDFRGFGGTPPDESEKVVPHRCAMDVESVLKWIAERHGLSGHPHREQPSLLGWSQGALVAQLTAQRSPHLISKLALYGSIYDPLVRYPRAPLYSSKSSSKCDSVIMNDYDSAIEDFTIEGSIEPEQARLFATNALITDPIKANWSRLDEFNNLDPARVNIPTLVIAGDQDPYAPLRVQRDLFSNLGRGSDRTWNIISDADHAVHLLEGRERFIRTIKNFVENI